MTPIPRLQDQVQVVAHQAEQVQAYLELRHALAEHAQKTLVVGVVPKDRPPFVAPGRHVIHGPFIRDPLWPRHTPPCYRRPFSAASAKPTGRASCHALKLKIRADPRPAPHGSAIRRCPRFPYADHAVLRFAC
jgi:hypothetical protein